MMNWSGLFRVALVVYAVLLRLSFCLNKNNTWETYISVSEPSNHANELQSANTPQPLEIKCQHFAERENVEKPHLAKMDLLRTLVCINYKLDVLNKKWNNLLNHRTDINTFDGSTMPTNMCSTSDCPTQPENNTPSTIIEDKSTQIQHKTQDITPVSQFPHIFTEIQTQKMQTLNIDPELKNTSYTHITNENSGAKGIVSNNTFSEKSFDMEILIPTIENKTTKSFAEKMEGSTQNTFFNNDHTSGFNKENVRIINKEFMIDDIDNCSKKNIEHNEVLDTARNFVENSRETHKQTLPNPLSRLPDDNLSYSHDELISFVPNTLQEKSIKIIPNPYNILSTVTLPIYSINSFRNTAEDVSQTFRYTLNFTSSVHLNRTMMPLFLQNIFNSVFNLEKPMYQTSEKQEIHFKNVSSSDLLVKSKTIDTVTITTDDKPNINYSNSENFANTINTSDTSRYNTVLNKSSNMPHTVLPLIQTVYSTSIQHSEMNEFHQKEFHSKIHIKQTNVSPFSQSPAIINDDYSKINEFIEYLDESQSFKDKHFKLDETHFNGTYMKQALTNSFPFLQFINFTNDNYSEINEFIEFHPNGSHLKEEYSETLNQVFRHRINLKNLAISSSFNFNVHQNLSLITRETIPIDNVTNIKCNVTETSRFNFNEGSDVAHRTIRLDSKGRHVCEYSNVAFSGANLDKKEPNTTLGENLAEANRNKPINLTIPIREHKNNSALIENQEIEQYLLTKDVPYQEKNNVTQLATLTFSPVTFSPENKTSPDHLMYRNKHFEDHQNLTSFKKDPKFTDSHFKVTDIIMHNTNNIFENSEFDTTSPNSNVSGISIFDKMPYTENYMFTVKIPLNATVLTIPEADNLNKSIILPELNNVITKNLSNLILDQVIEKSSTEQTLLSTNEFYRTSKHGFKSMQTNSNESDVHIPYNSSKNYNYSMFTHPIINLNTFEFKQNQATTENFKNYSSWKTPFIPSENDINTYSSNKDTLNEFKSKDNTGSLTSITEFDFSENPDNYKTTVPQLSPNSWADLLFNTSKFIKTSKNMYHDETYNSSSAIDFTKNADILTNNVDQTTNSIVLDVSDMHRINTWEKYLKSNEFLIKENKDNNFNGSSIQVTTEHNHHWIQTIATQKTDYKENVSTVISIHGNENFIDKSSADHSSSVHPQGLQNNNLTVLKPMNQISEFTHYPTSGSTDGNSVPNNLNVNSSKLVDIEANNILSNKNLNKSSIMTTSSVLVKQHTTSESKINVNFPAIYETIYTSQGPVEDHTKSTKEINEPSNLKKSSGMFYVRLPLLTQFLLKLRNNTYNNIHNETQYI